jgi:integrase
MATQNVPAPLDRHTYQKDNRRDPDGFTFRFRANGDQCWYGWISGRGRVSLGVLPKREARAMWDELRGKVSKGEKLPDRKVGFAPLAEEWFESKTKIRRSTRDLYRMALDVHILPRFGGWKVAALDAEAVAKFIRALEKKGLSQSTVENYLLPLKGTLDLAVRRGIIPSNPYVLLTSDERPDDDEDDGEESHAYEWSDSEIDALLKSSELIARQPEARQDYAPVLRGAVRFGLRLGELLGLDWGDVDLDQGVLHVRRQWTKYGELTPPKTKKSRRRVPLAPEDVAFVRRLKLASRYPQDGDPVYASRTGGRLSHRNVQRRGFEAARDMAELPETLTFHDLRHAFASIAHSKGVPVMMLSTVMGHSNVGVTQKVYLHLYGREQAEDAFRAAMSG